MATSDLKIVLIGKDKASGPIKGVTRSLGSLGKAAAIGVAGVAAGSIAIGGAMLKMAADAAPLEGIQNAFVGIAAAAGKGSGEMLDALQKGSLGMIAQRDLMESFNKAAMLVSKDFATTLPDAMGYLGKISAATGQDMGFMLDSLVTGVGRLSPMILDNLGIQVSLSEANEAYAKSIGKNVKELTKQEQQTALTNQVLEKLAENTAAMPDITDNASTQMAQMGATWKDTKDMIGKAFLPVLKLAMKGLTFLAKKILPPLTKFIEKKVRPAINKLEAGFETFFGYLEKGFDPLMAFQAMLGRLGLADLANQITNVKMKIQPFLDILWDLKNYFAFVLEEGDTLNDFLANLPGVIQPVVKAIGDMVVWIQENIELKDVLIALGLAIASIVVPAILSVVVAIAPLIAAAAGLVLAVHALRKAWETDWGGIRTALIEFWDKTAKPAIKELVVWLEENIPRAIDKAKDFFINTLKPAMEDVWKWVKEKLIPTIGDLVDWLKTNIPKAMQTVQEFWNTVLKPALEALWEFIQDPVIPIIEKLYAWLNENIPIAFETVQTFWNTVLKPALTELWEFVRDNVIPIIEDAYDWLKEKIPEAYEAIKEAWNTVLKPALQGLWDFLTETVIPIIEKVYSWFAEKIPEAFRAVVNAWNTHLKPILLDIEGIIRGIYEIAMKAVSAIKDLVGLKGEVGGPSGGGGSGFGSEADIQSLFPSSSTPTAGVAAAGATTVVIYGGLSAHGVQDANGLLAELQGMAV